LLIICKSKHIKLSPLIFNILKIFPEEVALNFIETFVDKDEHILLRSKIKSLVDSFEKQLIYRNYQTDIYSMVSIIALLHIKMDRLFSRQIIFYNKDWNQLIWCEKAKLANSRQPFDKNRHLVLDFSNQQLRNSLYSFENLDKENLVEKIKDLELKMKEIDLKIEQFH